MTRRRATAAVIAAAFLGAGVLIGRGTAASAPAGLTPQPKMGIALVERADLVSTDLVDGTLGYAPGPPVLNRLRGTYTSLPREGVVLAAGQALYRVDDLPVVLLTGTLPAWRTLGLGVADGPDVTELQANLQALGYGAGLIAGSNGHFGPLTALAVARWQRAEGLAVTGVVDSGRIVFLPGAVRVGATGVALGQAAEAGQQPFAATTSTRIVTIPLDAGRQDEVHPGDHVTIDMVGSRMVGGTISQLGLVATATPDPGNGPPRPPTVTVTVTPSDPSVTGTLESEPVQVELTARSASGVLAAPITALLALAEGGYGVEVIEPGGAHRLVGVHTGLFANTLVQVSGPGITVGTRVVVAQ